MRFADAPGLTNLQPPDSSRSIVAAFARQASTLNRTLMQTRWRRLLDVDDAERLRGVAELFNLDGAHINSSPSKSGRCVSGCLPSH